MPAAAESVTVKLAVVVPLTGSVTVASPMLKLGAAVASRMVPVPLAWAMLPALGAERFSAKASVPSYSASAFTATVTVLLVSPAAKVSVPEVAV